MRTYILLGIILVFAACSLVMLGSIAPSLVMRQAFFFIFGLFCFGVVQFLPFQFYQRIAPFAYIFLLVLLIITFLMGHTSKGSTRWISLGVTQIQPSQIIKPVLAVFLAGFAATGVWTKKKLFHFLILSGVPLVLVFIQPDLGTTLVSASIVGTILLFSGIPKRYMAFLVVLGVLIGILGWNVLLKDYQKQRIFSFLAPTEDVQGSRYHAQQSVIAVGSGKILGRGLGHGVQSHLRFLPEKQTDFMYASLSEEFGFIGSVAVILLYGAMFFFIIHELSLIKNTVAFLTICGVLFMLFVQTVINIGMNIGLLPITGITLPLLSYGGSSILTICISLGVLVSASKERVRVSAIEIR